MNPPEVRTAFRRLNLAPDEPFGGFPPDDPDDIAADPDTTGQVMQFTVVAATSVDRAGLFVWHCHIVEHEDHEMMRPYRIGP